MIALASSDPSHPTFLSLTLTEKIRPVLLLIKVFLGGEFLLHNSFTFLAKSYRQFVLDKWGRVFRERSDNFQLWKKGSRVIWMSLSR